MSKSQTLTAMGWPKDLREAVDAHLGELNFDAASGYWYDDNYRFARVGNDTEEAEYEAAVFEGCCGFYDKTIKVNGVEVMIGFNHGH